MSTNPPSFRIAFESQLAKLPPEHQVVFHSVFNALTDIYQALPLLKTQIDAKANATTTGSSSTTSASSSSTTTGVTSAQAASIATQTIQSTLNNVNPQTGTAYTVKNSDYAGMVTLNNAAAVAVTLGGDGTGVNEQFGTYIQNNGAGTATLTPASGQINGQPNLQLATSAGALVVFDGTNWSAVTSPTGATGGGVISLNALIGALSLVGGSGITITPLGSNITIAASGGSYIKGTVSVAASGTSGTFRGTGTVAGATTAMAAMASAPGLIALCGTSQVSWVCDVVSANTVEVQLSLPNVGPTWGTISFSVVVFP